MKSTNIKNVTVSYDEGIELEEVIATTSYYIDKLYPKVLDWLEIVRYPYDESMIDCRYHCKENSTFERITRAIFGVKRKV